MLRPIGISLCFLWSIFLCKQLLAYQVGHVIKDIQQEIPHDHNCFTQGLVFKDNILYETCGLYGKSSLRKVDMKTGKVLQSKHINKDIFAEGLTAANDTLYMLTWKNKRIYMYDRNTLELIATRTIQTHNGEGWGLTTDGKQLIVSDGSDRLLFYAFPDLSTGTEKDSLAKIREVRVFDPVNGRHINQVNELEFVNGFVFANLWYRDIIIQIDPATGHIIERYDMSSLYPQNSRAPGADCLNGIAYHAGEKYFLLTGKNWPKYYQLNFSAAYEPREF
jgi:glutamine cyclotransferase